MGYKTKRICFRYMQPRREKPYTAMTYAGDPVAEIHRDDQGWYWYIRPGNILCIPVLWSTSEDYPGPSRWASETEAKQACKTYLQHWLKTTGTSGESR